MNEGLNATPTQCDTVLVELHESTSPFNVAFTQNAILNTDGTLSLVFPSTAFGNAYYIGIKHRNSIETWSANPITLSANTNYDFTSSADQAFGDNQVEIESGVYAIYSGDLNQDGFIDSFDFPQLDTDIFNGVNGTYVNTDLNGDGFVDVFDFPVFDLNSSNGISVILP